MSAFVSKTFVENSHPVSTGTGTAVAPEPRTNLLVIEDDDNISTAINEYFSRAGYEVTAVGDGMTGVEFPRAIPDIPGGSAIGSTRCLAGVS